jgi:VCBS repeat-containing protein
LPFIIEGTPGCAASDIPWASASPNSGTTASGAATDVTVTFDSTGLSAGVYDGTLCVTSNDPANPLVEVPLTLTVEEGNIAPVAVPDTYTTDQDTVLNVAAPGVLGNDSDADSDPLTAVLDLTTSNGTLNLNADGSFTYTPDPGFSGADGFTYHANDGTADSNIVTVTINVVETEYVLYLPVVRKAETTQAQPEAGTQTSATEDWATVSLVAFPMALGMWVLYRRKDGFDI